MLLLTAVLLAVLGLWWYGEDAEPDPDPDATAVVWQVDADAVERVELQRAEGGRLALQRGEGGWRVVEPFEQPADADQVRELLDELRELGKGVPMDVALDRAAEFGLGEPPRIRVTVTLEDGSVASAAIGSEAPVGYRTYALDAQGAIVAVGGDPGRVLAAPAQQFRDHRLMAFTAAAVRRVRIESEQGTLEVHGQGTRWWLEGFGRADADRVDDLLLGLLDLRADRFLDVETDVMYPRYRVTVLDEGGGAVAELRVGDPTPMGSLVQIADGSIAIAAPEALALLGQGPTDLGAPSAFAIDLERSDTIEIRAGDAHFAARRNGGTWQADGLEGGAAWDAVAALADVPIVYRAEPPEAPLEAWAIVTVTEGDVTDVYEVGAEHDGFRPARSVDGGTWVRVPVDALDPAIGGTRPDNP